VQGFALGREYAFVHVRWGGATTLPCDRLWTFDDKTLICQFDGANPTPRVAPQGI